MKDARHWLERLRRDAEDCRIIAKLATHNGKKEIFARLAENNDLHANELEELIKSGELS
jgi:hypothetical protein